jgi:hypothetical protein
MQAPASAYNGAVERSLGPGGANAEIRVGDGAGEGLDQGGGGAGDAAAVFADGGRAVGDGGEGKGPDRGGEVGERVCGREGDGGGEGPARDTSAVLKGSVRAWRRRRAGEKWQGGTRRRGRGGNGKRKGDVHELVDRGKDVFGAAVEFLADIGRNAVGEKVWGAGLETALGDQLFAVSVATDLRAKSSAARPGGLAACPHKRTDAEKEKKKNSTNSTNNEMGGRAFSSWGLSPQAPGPRCARIGRGRKGKERNSLISGEESRGVCTYNSIVLHRKIVALLDHVLDPRSLSSPARSSEKAVHA